MRVDFDFAHGDDGADSCVAVGDSFVRSMDALPMWYCCCFGEGCWEGRRRRRRRRGVVGGGILQSGGGIEHEFDEWLSIGPQQRNGIILVLLGTIGGGGTARGGYITVQHSRAGGDGEPTDLPLQIVKPPE